MSISGNKTTIPRTIMVLIRNHRFTSLNLLHMQTFEVFRCADAFVGHRMFARRADCVFQAFPGFWARAQSAGCAGAFGVAPVAAPA